MWGCGNLTLMFGVWRPAPDLGLEQEGMEQAFLFLQSQVCFLFRSVDVVLAGELFLLKVGQSAKQ